MRKNLFRTLIVVLIVAGSFLAGSWATFQGSRSDKTPERKILYYVDPMNPGFRSDKPGIASCGMPLEPVYADEGDTAALKASLPPGTIRISPERQQLIGVKTMTVEKAPWSHTLRVLGRVAPDETRTYRINAAVNGWIEEAFPVTTGSLVKENELLASFYSLEYRSLVQNYFNLINISKEGTPGEKVVARTSQYSTGQLQRLREAARDVGQGGESAQLDYYRKNLLNYGMSAYQIEEMEQTRRIPDNVEIRSPIAGFILYRNVSPGLRFDRGAEFYRIADLSRVWILADLFETEAAYFQPGTRVRMELPYQKKTLYGQVSPVLPQFDPATRTLKVRLVADNPGYVMRPDMFVNVELPVQGPAAIIVPTDAVLDSGLKKTIFVDRGNSFFEPRQVETGRLLGDRVEITRGIMPGEKIVTSGNFLIDSEARMQLAASGIAGKIGRDPVCTMNIDEDRARAEGQVRDYKGKRYFFCSTECRDAFGKEPERYLKASQTPGTMPAAKAQAAATNHDHPSPAPTAKPRGAKAASEGHAGMAMPAAPSPAAMPGMTDEAATMAKPKTGAGMISPPAVGAAPGGRPAPSFSGPGPGNMAMPGGQPVPASPGAMNAPPAFAPGMNGAPPPFPGPSGAPLPGPQPGGPTAPQTVSGMGPGLPAAPGSKGAPGTMPSLPPGSSPGPGAGGPSLPATDTQR